MNIELQVINENYGLEIHNQKIDNLWMDVDGKILKYDYRNGLNLTFGLEGIYLIYSFKSDGMELDLTFLNPAEKSIKLKPVSEISGIDLKFFRIGKMTIDPLDFKFRRNSSSDFCYYNLGVVDSITDKVSEPLINADKVGFPTRAISTREWSFKFSISLSDSFKYSVVQESLGQIQHRLSVRYGINGAVPDWKLLKAVWVNDLAFTSAPSFHAYNEFTGFFQSAVGSTKHYMIGKMFDQYFFYVGTGLNSLVLEYYPLMSTEFSSIPSSLDHELIESGIIVRAPTNCSAVSTSYSEIKSLLSSEMIRLAY